MVPIEGNPRGEIVMFPKILMTLWVLFMLAALLGALACAGGINPVFAFTPLAIISTVAVGLIIFVIWNDNW